MQRLDEVYYSSDSSDNDVIIRVLNTILDYSEESESVLDSMLYFVEIFEQLESKSEIKRPAVKYIIDQTTKLNGNFNFNIFVEILETNHNKDNKNYEHIWMMCFLRAVFYVGFFDKVYYKIPEYAVRIASGENEWHVFLEAFEKKHYVKM